MVARGVLLERKVRAAIGLGRACVVISVALHLLYRARARGASNLSKPLYKVALTVRKRRKAMAPITISRTRFIGAPPATVFAVLADPQQLGTLLPRVRRVEFLERGPQSARIATHMAFGPFGDVRTEGDVRWQEGRELVFESQRPVPVTSRWTLTPSGAGTELLATLALDLTALIGPLAAFVPPERVADVVAPDLDAALAEIARRTQAQ